MRDRVVSVQREPSRERRPAAPDINRPRLRPTIIAIDGWPFREMLTTRQQLPDAPPCMWGSLPVIAVGPSRTSYSRSRRPLHGTDGRSCRSTGRKVLAGQRPPEPGLGWMLCWMGCPARVRHRSCMERLSAGPIAQWS